MQILTTVTDKLTGCKPKQACYTAKLVRGGAVAGTGLVAITATECNILVYSASQKNPPFGFLTIFPKRMGILINFLHTYYMFLSTIEYKFLFNFLQL